jgi:hypothetical protein
VKIGPHVTPESWEATVGGHEEIWVDFDSSFGSFKHDARLLYDPSVGSLGTPSATDSAFQPPFASGQSDGYVWLIVHDNRGGAAWVTVPVHLDP